MAKDSQIAILTSECAKRNDQAFWGVGLMSLLGSSVSFFEKDWKEVDFRS